MDAVVTLRWDYSPAKFFEEPISQTLGPTQLKIDNGTAEATIPANAYDANPALCDSLSVRVESYFRATSDISASRIQARAADDDPGRTRDAIDQDY